MNETGREADPIGLSSRSRQKGKIVRNVTDVITPSVVVTCQMCLLCIYVHVCKMNRLCSMLLLFFVLFFSFASRVHCLAFVVFAPLLPCLVCFLRMTDCSALCVCLKMTRMSNPCGVFFFCISSLHVLNHQIVCILFFFFLFLSPVIKQMSLGTNNCVAHV